VFGIDEPGISDGWITTYVRVGDRIFQTYETGGRGCEAMMPPLQLLDMTVYGRQEEWGHRRAGRLRCRDSQLLPKLADKALFRILPLLNMTARQVPHVGIPTASGASMTQQHPIAVAKNGRHNPDRTGVVSRDRHRHILTHADLPQIALPPRRRDAPGYRE
jgi:hypothetical protein